jgi:prepilin-type N-terminal cleavage/methylation domain-containing protein
MPTSIQTISKSQKGFSLPEIMVAIVLIAMIMMSIPMDFLSSDHALLEEDIDNLDRASRMAQNEAVLRNVITRVRIDLEKEPIEFAVEYGTSSDIVLPESQDIDKLSLKEVENRNKKIKNFEAQFAPVEEFTEEVKTLSDVVKVEGIASTSFHKIMKEGNIGIYFYPTGERDGAQIYLSTAKELAYLEIQPFLEETLVEFFDFSSESVASLDQTKENKIRDWFETWLKK